MSGKEDKSAKKQALKNRIDKETEEILKQIDNNFTKISLNYQNQLVGGDINSLDFLLPEVDEQIQKTLPKEIQGEKVCKIQVKSLQNYQKALKQYNTMMQKIDGKNDKNKEKDDLEAYDQRSFRVIRAYLTPNQLLFNWDQGKRDKQIKISEYRYIVVQERKLYQSLKTSIRNYKAIMNKIAQDSQKKSSWMDRVFSKNKEEVNEKIRQKTSLVDTRGFFLTQKWYLPDIESAYRIICIHSRPQVPNSNFYIYFQTFIQQKDKQPLQSLKSALAVKDRLILAHLADKNKKKIMELSQQYKNNTQKNIFSKMIAEGLKNNFMGDQQKLTEIKINTSELLQKYRANNLQQMISGWLKKARQCSKLSKTYIIVESYSISIPKTIAAKLIDLYINNDHYSEMVYSGQNNQSWIFKPTNIKKITIDLQKTKLRLLEFKVNIEDQRGRRTSLKNNVKISKIQNQALGFAYELGLIPQNKQIPQNFKQDFPYVLIFDAIIQRVNLRLMNPDITVRKIRQINLLSKIGKIPNLYSSYFQFNYSPKIMSNISSVFNDKKSNINKLEFQRSYLDFLNFFQHEENKSQNFCLYLTMKKKNNVSLGNLGFLMGERYMKYCDKLKHSMKSVEQIYRQIGKGDLDHFIKSSIQISISKKTKKKDLANLKNDMAGIQLYNKDKIDHVLKRYIIFCDFYNKREQKSNYYLGYNISLINIADHIIEIYQRSFGENQRAYQANINFKDLLIFFTAFILQIYPYHRNPTFIQKDMYHIRALAQSKLPQINYKLNRAGIGLQNFAANHLLSLFSCLPMQLCLRIWDLMIENTNKLKQMRIITVYTILLYQQKSNLAPIYPINQIIESIDRNMQRVNLDQAKAYHFNKIVEELNQVKTLRRSKIRQYATQKILRRFIYGRNYKQGNILDEEQLIKPCDEKKTDFKGCQQRLQIKLLSLNQLNYPLPRPNYQGSSIGAVYIFIGGIFILRNLNFHRKGYKIQINTNDGSVLHQLDLKDKNVYLNQYFKLDVQNEKTSRIQIRLMENRRQIMQTILYIGNYHKDRIYKENLYFNDIADKFKNNLGTSVIEVSLILRNLNPFPKRVEQTKNKEYEIYQKLFDYDLQSGNNQVIRAMNILNRTLGKVLEPLDQLNVDEYANLKMPIALPQEQADWILNSKISIEQLKAILNVIFADDNEKHIRLKLPNLYENYSEDFQLFNFGKFLLQLILITSMSISKKISMLFCICVHYQNITHPTGSQKITIDTVNSVIREIYNSQGVINSCPYSGEHIGQILYACYYQKGQKVEEKKKQITNIVQDWAAICRIYYKSGGIMLGSATHLNVLKSMLPGKTLAQIQKTEFCRFQIIYRNNKSVFIWSSTVKSQTFQIIRRGVKFLNSYPKYDEEIKYFDSIGQIFLNCQNFIPLQETQAISYYQFLQVFKKNPLLYYLMGIEKESDSNSQQQLNEIYALAHGGQLSRISHASSWNQRERNAVIKQYTDFGLFRYQNCHPEWKKCIKIRQVADSPTTIVIFQDLQGEFEIPTYQLITMDQNLNEDQDNSQISSLR